SAPNSPFEEFIFSHRYQKHRERKKGGGRARGRNINNYRLLAAGICEEDPDRMGKDSKPKEKGKGKQSGSGGDEIASKGKGKAGKSDGLGTCTYVKARHVLCEKQGKINEAYKKLEEGWLSNGDKVPPAEFAKIAAEYSECPSGKKGGDLGWFPRGKMAGPFQDVAFSTPLGATSAPFKSTHGYHIILCEGRKN
ncbi:Peptidyl-prolyl cis-trans isomerase NIMA-interacting 4, partial [Nymphaea thermarum]